MFQFVYWLKAIAAVLITNSHYAKIWPISSLAIGGQLGNCLFFFVSGFTLYNIKDSFPLWYAKRIIRIYPALWIANIVNFLIGVFHCFIYPTWFHFIASIMLLYLVYYGIRLIQKHWKLNTIWIVLAVLLVDLILYILIFDKSYYHIDDVEKPWVRFMFLEAMLIGAWMREKYERIPTKIGALDYGLFFLLSLIYFGGKKLISNVQSISMYQFALPVILLIYLSWIVVLFVKFEKNGYYRKVAVWITACVKYIAGITLEIYLIQFILIQNLSPLPFPVNFLGTTGAILLCAWILHFISAQIQKPLGKALKLE